MADDDLLRLQTHGILEPGQAFRRASLFDTLYASLPRDTEARVQMYHYEIAPGGFTNWHLHNGATFFMVLQGQFEAHFEDGTIFRAKAGDVYSEPIGKVHRGHNPHASLANIGVGISLTSPDREPVTSVADPAGLKGS